MVNGVDVDPVESCVDVRPAPVDDEPGDQARNWLWGSAYAADPENVDPVDGLEVLGLDCDNQDLEFFYTVEILNGLGSELAHINKLNFGYFVNDQFISQVVNYDPEVSFDQMQFDPLDLTGLPIGEHVIWAQFEFDEFGGREFIDTGITNLTLDIESDWVQLLQVNQTCENVLSITAEIVEEVCVEGGSE